jgi:putative nucleotidyltransferase-like protein
LRIELHWRLFLNPHAMAETSIMAASRVVPLAGAAGLRTLGEEDLFAYLCMHGALHWWYRLKWLADVNALLAPTAEDGVERLVRSAEARGAGRAAAQTLLLCRRLFATPLPDRLMATLAKSATVRWLEATALDAMISGQGEREPREERFGTTRGSLSTFLLSRSWRYRLAELGTHLTNQTDILAVPLPEWLRFLYPILRLPFWVWRHARRRAGSNEKNGRYATTFLEDR